MRIAPWLPYVALYLGAGLGANYLLFPGIPHRQGPVWGVVLGVNLGFLALVPWIGEGLHRKAQALPLTPGAQRRLVAWLETSMLTVLTVTAANLVVALQGRPEGGESLLALGLFLLLWRLRRWLG